MRDRFDIISLDPRSAGRTRPLACNFDMPPFTGGDDATLQAFFDERARLVAEQCLDDDHDFVLSISGNTFARDIEQFRRALGERHPPSASGKDKRGTVRAERPWSSYVQRKVLAKWQSLIRSPGHPIGAT